MLLPLVTVRTDEGSKQNLGPAIARRRLVQAHVARTQLLLLPAWTVSSIHPVLNSNERKSLHFSLMDDATNVVTMVDKCFLICSPNHLSFAFFPLPLFLKKSQVVSKFSSSIK